MDILIILALVWFVTSIPERRLQKQKKASRKPRQTPKMAGPTPQTLKTFVQEFAEDLEAQLGDRKGKGGVQDRQGKDGQVQRQAPEKRPQPILARVAKPEKTQATLTVKESGLRHRPQALQRPRLKSRYADRSIHVGMTPEEKKSLGLAEASRLSLDYDGESIRKGFVWQQILNPPRARSPWKV